MVQGTIVLDLELWYNASWLTCLMVILQTSFDALYCALTALVVSFHFV